MTKKHEFELKGAEMELNEGRLSGSLYLTGWYH